MFTGLPLTEDALKNIGGLPVSDKNTPSMTPPESRSANFVCLKGSASQKYEKVDLIYGTLSLNKQKDASTSNKK